MGVHKQSISFTDPAFDHVRTLVEIGEYPTISAAVSGELMRARAARAREAALFEAELERRLALPPDRWEPVGSVESLLSGARARLAARQGTGGG